MTQMDLFIYTLDLMPIEYTLCEKDLGINTVPKLTWTDHTNILYSRANQRLGMIKRNCSDQFSEKSKYDIDIDFSDDLKNNINFDFREIRILLKSTNVNKHVVPMEFVAEF